MRANRAKTRRQGVCMWREGGAKKYRRWIMACRETGERQTTLPCRPHPTALPFACAAYKAWLATIAPPPRCALASLTSLPPPQKIPQRAAVLGVVVGTGTSPERAGQRERDRSQPGKRQKHSTLREAASSSSSGRADGERERKRSIYGDAVCLPVSGSRPPPPFPAHPLLPRRPAHRGGGRRRAAASPAAARDEREVGGEAGALHAGAVRGAGAPGAHIQVPRRRRARPAGPAPPHPPWLRLPPACPCIRALLRQEGGPGARAVPAYGRQEVAVRQGGRPGLQVLRAPHASRPQPFKKACGTAARHPGAHPAPAGTGAGRQLPEPLDVPGAPQWQRRPSRRWRGRWWHRDWHVRPRVHRSAAHGQCCCLRDRCWWWEQRSQVFCIRDEVSVGRAQPADARHHGKLDGQLVAPAAVPDLYVPGHKLPSLRHAERPGREHHRVASQDRARAALLLRQQLRDREAGEPDAAPLLRRVAQGEGLVGGARRRQQQPRVLFGDAALHLHSHGDLRLLQHQLPIAERNTIKVRDRSIWIPTSES